MTSVRGNRAVNAVIREALEQGAPGKISSAEMGQIKSAAIDQLERSGRPTTTLGAISRSFENANGLTDNRYTQRFAQFLEELGALTAVAPEPTASEAIPFAAVSGDVDTANFKVALRADGQLTIRGNSLAEPGEVHIKVGTRSYTIDASRTTSGRKFIDRLRDALGNKDVLVTAQHPGTYTVQLWPTGKAPRPEGAPIYADLHTQAGVLDAAMGPLSFKLVDLPMPGGKKLSLRVDNQVFTVNGGGDISTVNDALIALRRQLRAAGYDATIKTYAGYPTSFTVTAG